MNIKYDTICSARNILSAQYTALLLPPWLLPAIVDQQMKTEGRALDISVSVFAPVPSLFSSMFPL